MAYLDLYQQFIKCSYKRQITLKNIYIFQTTSNSIMTSNQNLIRERNILGVLKPVGEGGIFLPKKNYDGFLLISCNFKLLK
jgi:hypothetical protein